MKLYTEFQITPMPAKYFKHKHALDGLFGVCLVWQRKKDAVAYYKKMGMKLPDMIKTDAVVESFKNG